MENILFFFANLPVYSYGAMLGLGLVIGSLLAQREGKRKGIGADFMFSFIVQVTIAFVIVGRFACVFRIYGWRTFLYPWTLLSSAQLDEYWGLGAAVIYAVYFVVRNVQNPAVFFDALTPSAALMQSLAYLGSSVLGRETTKAWGINLGEFSLHPLPLYSALAYYAIFSFLWWMRRNLRYDGQLFLGYLALSALSQHILMRYREVFGESTHPWLYFLAFLVFGCSWFYLYLQSPFTDSRRRRNLTDWRSWLMYLASLLGVGLVMIKFFYWRFS
ncbi:MAG: prolipoprotein diacylglyceryl transferase [Firmicutes bacterium]|nr:prolipoprotein diacylglyceryl transferase [Bacillota bacterium]